MATIIDGKALAAKVRERAAADVAALAGQGISCGLAVVLVGDDQASATYVRSKLRDCEQCGIRSFDYKLPAETSQDELMDLVRRLNADDEVAGILVQMPLPAHLDTEEVVAAIDPDKDVDGFHPMNMGRLVRGLPGLRPCTPAGIMEMLDEYGIDPAGKNAVIVGRSSIVGKPMSLMLLARHATISVAHSRTDPHELARICQSADILVAACGDPLQTHPKPLKAHAPAGPGVDGVVQQGLDLAGGVQAQVQGQNILPRPVEKGHLPAAVGAGELDGLPPAQVCLRLRRGKSGGGETLPKPVPE